MSYEAQPLEDGGNAPKRRKLEPDQGVEYSYSADASHAESDSTDSFRETDMGARSASMLCPAVPT